jgi:GNAT superfamily N-acetyltransferase
MRPDPDLLHARLAETGPAGVWLRFVLRHTGRADLFDVRPGALIGSGRPARVFVADAAWIFGSDPTDAQALLDAATAERAVYWMAPGEPSGWNQGRDHVLVASPRPAETAVITGEAFLRMPRHPALEDLVPPPHILGMLPFRFHGLVRDGVIVAMCDTTVDDGEAVAIAQVHTAPELRGQGLATELIEGVLSQVHGLGRTTAVWLCDEENSASRALAARCGFELRHVVPRLTRPA